MVIQSPNPKMAFVLVKRAMLPLSSLIQYVTDELAPYHAIIANAQWAYRIKVENRTEGQRLVIQKIKGTSKDDMRLLQLITTALEQNGSRKMGGNV